MIRDILLVVDNASKADPIITAALALAERNAALLTVEILTTGPLLVPALGPLTEMYEPEQALADDEAARVDAVTRRVANSPCTVRVLGLHDGMFGVARRAGRAGPVADLVVMGDPAAWDSEWLHKHAAKTMIIGGGTPLLVAAGAAPLAPVGHAAIGWKDSPETRRALHDLVAMVEPGGRISVVAVAQDQAEIDAAGAGLNEAARHLQRHGFVVDVHQVLAGIETDAHALAGFAHRSGADLLAVGAFAHSRLRDIALGGVTHAMIERPPLPLLLSR